MAAPAPIRVLIVDDHPVVRAGLIMIVQAFDDLHLVGEASNGLEAVKLCAEHQPDVVLMDIKMPQMDGIIATRIIHQAQPDIQIVALTSLSQGSKASEVINAGASACLSKDVSVAVLLQSIRHVGSKTFV